VSLINLIQTGFLGRRGAELVIILSTWDNGGVRRFLHHVSCCLLAAAVASGVAVAADPVSPPKSVKELWADFDADAPLDVETVRKWDEGGGHFQLVRYTVGTFKGARRTHKPRLAAWYGYPRAKAKRRLPGIVQIHGGGQRARLPAVRYWVSLGYAAISINWGEKVLDLDGVKDQTDTPNTDWDGLAAGFLGGKDLKHHNVLLPGPATLSGKIHPKNSSWYLTAYAARRALTFLAKRPEVDAAKLGVTGHSMGGRLTVLTAIDPRVKAAVPSVGGSGFLYEDIWGIPRSARHMTADAKPGLYAKAIAAQAYWPHIRCPILFLGATNDFNSPTEKVVRGMGLLPHRESRLVLAPHLNHRFTSETYSARPLWFEAHLKGNFAFPKTPQAKLILKRDDGIPVLRVCPDAAGGRKVVKIDIYYGYARDPRVRFWCDARAGKTGDAWEGKCPVTDLAEPLFAFANVTFDIGRNLPLPAGYSKRTNRLTLASTYCIAHPADLARAGVKATEKPSRLIDDFKRGWHDWYRLERNNPHHWFLATRKPVDPRWTGPKGAKLAFDIKTTAAGAVLGVEVHTNEWRGYTGAKRDTFIAVSGPLKAGWNSVTFAASDFKNTKGQPLKDWTELTRLAFRPANRALPENKTLKRWPGRPPTLRNLRWE